MTKTKTKSAWHDKKANASITAGRIQSLGYDEDYDEDTVRGIAETFAAAFDFTDEESDEFVKAALVDFEDGE